MTQRLGLAKPLRFVVIKPDSTPEAQGSGGAHPKRFQPVEDRCTLVLNRALLVEL